MGLFQSDRRCSLAVDIGGTFTDVVLLRDGQTTSRKVLTTPTDPSRGFMDGVGAVLNETSTAPSDIELIIHGTTLATNALIERRGAKTALITTWGHRDALEMAYEHRFAQYDINADRPTPLVPRERRLAIKERLNFQGDVVEALDENSIEALVPVLEEADVKSIAIGLLHAYANPAHEERAADLLRARLPDIPVSLSSEVCPEIREYDRQSTTVANAYIKPLIGGYLATLRQALTEAGFNCPCLLMTSGGHLVTIDTAMNYPVRLIESGPAGGAILASHIARSIGAPQVLSFDMGGTTAKICLIDDGKPQLGRALEVDRAHRFMKGSGFPVKIPVIEMVEIGAGGGSLAHVDDLRRIRVGPESAGAEPGPACYGRGGTRPTVTDANLVLGRLDGDAFAGGRMQLDPKAAELSLASHVGDSLGISSTDAAVGVIETVDEAMASAARVHAVELGKDISQRTMIAFGGAAPLHAARLADKLDISRIIIPANAGVGSAVGFLLAPVAYEVVRSRYQKLSSLDVCAVSSLFDDMRNEAVATVRLAAPLSDLEEHRFAFARYVGQGHEIKVLIRGGKLNEDEATRIREAFEMEYSRQYGRCVPGLEIEILTWSLTVAASRSTPEADLETDEAAALPPAPVGNRRVHFSGQAVSVNVFDRASILSGVRLSGPAAIVEPQTTILVPPDFEVHNNPSGDLILERAGKHAEEKSANEALRDQIIWDRLIAVVEEQAQALIRTAFSTTVREAGDLSAGVFDLDGRMLAQAVTGTPGHVNAMAASVIAFLKRFPAEQMCDGDVYVTNDPWLGTGHLWDFTVVSPAFHKDRPVGLLAATIHVIDVGGRGFGPDAGQVFEEGICIPIMQLFNAGEPNQAVFEIIEANVRQPVELTGDLYSLTACNAVGVHRLVSMMDEFDLADLCNVGDQIINASRQAMQDEIAKLPNGIFENSMTTDGYEAPVTLKARMQISGDRIAIDFSGTSLASQFGINVPLTYTHAYTSFGIRCIVGSAIPNNAGSLSPILVSAPEGSILNALRPAAVAVRHVIGQMLPDLVLGCLEAAVPGCAPAEGSSSLWNPMLAGGPGVTGEQDYGNADPFTVTIFHSGGTGARPGKDGLSATAFPSGVRNTPVEITESVAPVIFMQKEYRHGSGGSGKWRGGDGQTIEIKHADDAPFAVFALFDRIVHPARGRAGGGNGAAGIVRLGSGSLLKGMGKQIIPAGDSLVLDLPGGGGIGKAKKQ